MTTQTVLAKSRRERREEAREAGIEFVPQYNFGQFDMQENGQPLKVQHPVVAKIERNEARRKARK
jgi:hypothetical protein